MNSHRADPPDVSGPERAETRPTPTPGCGVADSSLADSSEARPWAAASSDAGGAATTPRLPRAGDRVGPYVLRTVLGQGGMGAVYRGERPDSGLTHAVKVMLVGDFMDATDARARFRREAEALARVDAHPGIVRVHAFGDDGGRLWCAMEHVEGRSLGERVQAGPIPPREAATIAAAVARAVAHLHRHGVLHRDLKPSNIIIEKDSGRPRLIDFGLARVEGSVTLTRTNDAVGTPSYMAPEQVAGGSAGVGPTADVYGLGAVLYALLSGRAPFEGASMSIMIAVIEEQPAPLGELVVGLPRALGAICERALRKHPEDRQQSADELAEQLEAFLAGERVHFRGGGRSDWLARALRRPRRLTFAAPLVLCAAVGLGALLTWGRGGPAGPSLVARVGGLERALAERGRLSAEERAELAAMQAGGAAAADAGLARRIEVVATLEELTERLPRDAELARLAARLQALIRPGGRLDATALGLVAGQLHRTRRLALLAAVLHGAEPVARAPREVAADLARAIAVGRDGAPEAEAPADDGAFAALYEAPGLADDARGRLLVARARAFLARGDVVAALDAVVRAWRAHEVAPAAGWWAEQPLAHEAAWDAFIAALGDEGRARAFHDLLVMAAAERHGIDAERAAALQNRLLPPRGLGIAGGPAPDPEASVLVASLLDAHGLSPLSDDILSEFWGGLEWEWVAARAAREVDRGRPNAAVLLLLARLALVFRRSPGWDADRAEEWTAAAGRAGVEAPALHLQLGYIIEWMGDEEDPRALVALERAYELDRERPLQWRIPAVAERLCDGLADFYEEGDDPASQWRALAVARDGIAVQRAADERTRAIQAAGGKVPWMSARHADLVRQLSDAAENLIALDPPRCCERPGEDAPAIDEVLEAAFGIIEPDSKTEGYLYCDRGLHHAGHERWAEAVADFTRAIDSRRRYLQRTPDADRAYVRQLGGFHYYRARALHALGRHEEEDRDDAVSERLRR